MEKNVLLDTNILIKTFREKNSKFTEKIYALIKTKHTLNVSSITRYKFFRGGIPKCEVVKDEKDIMSIFLKRKIKYMQLFAKFNINSISFDSKVAEVCTNLYALLKMRNKEPKNDYDFLIAGTAVCNNCKLYTDNSKHFKHIPLIELIDEDYFKFEDLKSK